MQANTLLTVPTALPIMQPNVTNEDLAALCNELSTSDPQSRFNGLCLTDETTATAQARRGLACSLLAIHCGCWYDWLGGWPCAYRSAALAGRCVTLTLLHLAALHPTQAVDDPAAPVAFPFQTVAVESQVSS